MITLLRKNVLAGICESWVSSFWPTPTAKCSDHAISEHYWRFPVYKIRSRDLHRRLSRPLEPLTVEKGLELMFGLVLIHDGDISSYSLICLSRGIVGAAIGHIYCGM